MRKPKSQKIDSEQLAKIISTIGALLATIISLVAFLFDTKSFATLFPKGGMDTTVASKVEIESINAEILAIRQEQEKINSKIDALSQVTTETALSSELADVKNSVESINGKLSNIESLIVQDPQKALEIPLLRKDLDNLAATNEIQMTALRQDIERSYNLVLVTIVALAIAVLAPALTNIFKKDEKEKEKE